METIWIINHHALPPSLGGLNRHYYFKKELEKRGYNVKIFTASQIHNSDVNMMDKDKCFCKDIEVDGIEYSYIKTGQYNGNGLSRIKNMLEFAWKIKKIPKFYHEKPDVIYTSTPDLFTAYYAEKLAKKLNVPCIVEIRDLWPESIVEYKGVSRKNPFIKILYSLEKIIYKRAKSLVFTMEGGKQYIIDKKWDKDIDLNKVYNINNGVDLELFEKNKKEFTLNDGDLNNLETFKVVYCGSIRLVNNIKMLVSCAEQLKKENYKVKFLIYGDGNQRKELENYCKENNLDNIVFKGFVDKKYVPYILSKSDCNILNYQLTPLLRYGASQNKLFDYLASGKPIITNAKGNFDLIEKNNCGIALEEHSVEATKVAILKILNLSEEKRNIYCNNAMNAAKEYDFKVLTNKLLEILN